MEQNNAAQGQPTTQEGSAEATSGERSKQDSDYLSTSNEIQLKTNAVVQGEEVGEANKTAAGNQKKETLTVIPPTLIENQRLNTRKFLITRVRMAQKRKRAKEDSNLVAKKGWQNELYSELWILQFWFDSRWRYTSFPI